MQIQSLQSRLEKRRIKVSKCAERWGKVFVWIQRSWLVFVCVLQLNVFVLPFSFQLFFEQYAEYDPFITTPEPSNPWIADSTEFWEQENSQLVQLNLSYR